MFEFFAVGKVIFLKYSTYFIQYKMRVKNTGWKQISVIYYFASEQFYLSGYPIDCFDLVLH